MRPARAVTHLNWRVFTGPALYAKNTIVSQSKPCLVINYQKRAPIAYECALCGQRFILPDDRSPKEAMTELQGAFKEHIQEKHPEHAEPEM